MRAPVIAALSALLCVAALGDPAGAQPGSVRAPRTSESSGMLSAPGWLRPVLIEVDRAQRQLNAALSRNLRLVGREGSTAAALTVLGVAFLYGVLHAAGPGHGKVVIASFFLSREVRPLRGVLAGFAISFVQIITSIGLVAVLGLVFGYTGLDVTARATWGEVVSYGLITLLGLYLIVGALRSPSGDGHAHDLGRAEGPATGGLVLAAGLTPCPSGIILLLFALANGVFAFGVGASLVMAVGMGLTVSLAGLATIVARRLVVRPLTGSPLLGWVRHGLALAGSLCLTAVGVLFFVAAVARLH